MDNCGINSDKLDLILNWQNISVKIWDLLFNSWWAMIMKEGMFFVCLFVNLLACLFVRLLVCLLKFEHSEKAQKKLKQLLQILWPSWKTWTLIILILGYKTFLNMIYFYHFRPTVKQLLELPAVKKAKDRRARELYLKHTVQSVKSAVESALWPLVKINLP